jgi:hypothetical protein
MGVSWACRGRVVGVSWAEGAVRVFPLGLRGMEASRGVRRVPSRDGRSVLLLTARVGLGWRGCGGGGLPHRDPSSARPREAAMGWLSGAYSRIDLSVGLCGARCQPQGEARELQKRVPAGQSAAEGGRWGHAPCAGRGVRWSGGVSRWWKIEQMDGRAWGCCAGGAHSGFDGERRARGLCFPGQVSGGGETAT